MQNYKLKIKKVRSQIICRQAKITGGSEKFIGSQIVVVGTGSQYDIETKSMAEREPDQIAVLHPGSSE
jgi:hypothetical protein